MKITVTLVALLMSFAVSAQDIIKLKSGKNLNVKVTEVRPSEIIYKNHGADTLLSIHKGKVSQVEYDGGAVELFGDEKDLKKRVFLTANTVPKPIVDIGKYLGDNMKYPEEAQKKRIQGTVIARFIVNDDGTLSDFVITKSLGGGCDEEVLRVLRKMPPWEPGMIDGKPVNVLYTQPVNFKL